MIVRFICAAIWLLNLGLVTSADWREDVGRLRLGIVIGAEESVRERVEPFRSALETHLGVPVDLFLMDTMGGLVEAVTRGEVDYGRLSSTAYAVAYTLCGCIEPVAAPRTSDLADGFHSIVISKAENGLETIGDLEGKRLAVSSPGSTAGYRVPLATFHANGLDPASHFSALVRVKGPSSGLNALLDGRVDASLGWSTMQGRPDMGYSAGTLYEAYLSGRVPMSKLNILWKSERIPFASHAVRTDLPAAFKETLRKYLLALQTLAPHAYFAVEPDLSGGFVSVAHNDYRAVLRTYRSEWLTSLDMRR